MARNRHPELVFEKKNKGLQKLPKYARIEKRPIPHAPAASPYAGARVPKIVYVSSKTPFMSAVKRVQKLLREAEKRATSNINLQGKNDQQRLQELKEGAATLDKEEVFIKATGRAVDKAVSIGKWFEEKEEYGIRVKTGSVLVVDDIVEDEEMKEKLERKRVMNESSKKRGNSQDQSIGLPAETEELDSASSGWQAPASTETGAAPDDDEELPESRTRWIKMVEVAVRLKS